MWVLIPEEFQTETKISINKQTVRYQAQLTCAPILS